MDSGIALSYIWVEIYPTGWHILFGNKAPLKDMAGSCIGTYTNCHDVTNIVEFKTFLRLQHIDSKIHGKAQSPICYELLNQHTSFNLTEKQECCLFLMIRGKTAKEIAKILNLSHRTIEGHIDALKYKLNCQRKSEIIEKMLDNGYLYYIPKKIRENLLNKII